MSEPGWDGILDADERILWQGRPDGTVSLRPGNLALLAFGLFFAGFALIWMILASQGGGGFWMFGLIHFSVGIGIIWAALFWAAYRRRRSWYTLTDRRAFIASNLPLVGKRLKSWPITAASTLELDDSTPGSVNFAMERRRGKNGHYMATIGFERIPEAKQVYRLMRDIQTGARTAASRERT